jgi:hypothetical protein
MNKNMQVVEFVVVVKYENEINLVSVQLLQVVVIEAAILIHTKVRYFHLY